MRRIAFIGIENADSNLLHEALRRNLGADAEINAFERDVSAVKVAPFLVAKNKETGQLEGSGSVAYISASADPDLAKKIGRLHKAGVVIREGWSDFKLEASEGDIGAWLAKGEWPEPEPEDDEDDDEAALLALLGDDDEDDDDFGVQSPVAEEKVTPAPVVEEIAPPVAQVEEDDDLPVWQEDDDLPPAAQVSAETETYPTRRFDSMGANDGLVDSPRRAARPATEETPARFEENDDDDLPLPSFYSQEEDRSESPVTNPSFAASADNGYDEDDELPAFEASAPREDVAVERSAPAYDDNDDLPEFGSDFYQEDVQETRSAHSYDEDDELPAFVSNDSPVETASSDDEDDELPLFEAAPVRYQKVEPELEDDDLPAFDAPSRREEAPVQRQSEVVDPEDDDELSAWSSPVVEVEEPQVAPPRRAAAPVAPMPEPEDDFFQSDNAFGLDDEDDLAAFGAQEPREAPVSRRAARAEIPVVDKENDDEDIPLPEFDPEAFASVSNDRQQQFDDEQNYFGTSDDDDLPAFAPTQDAEEEAAPSRRSRKDFLRAAESLARQHRVEEGASQDEDDDEGDSLPDFSPEFAPPVLDDAEDDLPAPARRASARNDDNGDDLPEFAARVEKEAQEEEEDDSEFFEFAPKVKKPSYAAPAEQQPEWGIPVQPHDVVVEPDRVRREPVRREPAPEPVKQRVAPEPVQPRVAPEEVRYEDDVPAKFAAERARTRREEEGYQQPVIERDVPNRELRPAPGADSELRKPTRVVNKRPVPVEEPEDDFDPNAVAPYMQELEPEVRRAQSTMEQIRREYDSDAVMKVRGKGSATCYYVTGSHGGAGKTTSTWMMANTMATALKKDPTRPVFLIEGDYENSKLAQRLNLPPEKNSGKLAEFFRRLSSDMSLVSKQKINMAGVTEKIIKDSIYVNDHGVHIIAAPYDLTKRDGRFLRIAIQKSVEYAERQGGYVFIDADTLSNDDILDRTLAAKATHVVLVSFGDKDHVDDTHRAIHTLTTPMVKSVSNQQSTNGMGVPKDRIKLFFNKTGTERFEDLQRTMRPYLTEGHLPTVPGLNDGGWIGNLTGGDFQNAVISYASFMNKISPMPELRNYENRRPQKATQRSGFMKMFGGGRRG